MATPRLLDRRLSAREVADRRRRREDLRETADVAAYVALRITVVVLALGFACIAIYRMVVHGESLPAGIAGFLLYATGSLTRNYLMGMVGRR